MEAPPFVLFVRFFAVEQNSQRQVRPVQVLRKQRRKVQRLPRRLVLLQLPELLRDGWPDFS